MAASRFLVAGGLLLLYLKLVIKEPLRREYWLPASLMSALLLLGGNGGVVFAQQYVPSGVAALLVGCGPFWFVLLGWLWLKGPRPKFKAILGLILGFAGLVILIGPGRLSGASQTPILPALAVVAAALSWSIGSIYSKTLRLGASPLMMSSLQMLVGSVLLTGAGLLHGDHVGFHLSQITAQSWASWGYLVVFGSLVGFTAYIYVLRHASPALASTYAYVNPMVAVLVGWAIGGEAMSMRMIIAGAAIVGAVILISWPTRAAAVDNKIAPEHG